MLTRRLKALAGFRQAALPTWGADLSALPFDDINYYLKPKSKTTRTWADVPSAIRRTYDKIGVPEAEKKWLAGVGAQYDSEMVYHAYREALRKKGVIFVSMDEGLRDYPEIVKKYFGTLVPATDNKFAALNAAAWSGGSFVYVPKGVKVDLPLQAYFRINAKSLGQFERTLIIAEAGSQVHYIEGCSAPVYSVASLHAGVVEIFVAKGARVRYTTIQNWSTDVYNLVTKRARVDEEGTMEWIDGNIGSRATMKYPACYLVGRKAHGEVLSLALAHQGQHQDTGARMLHLAPETSSIITSKSVVKKDGRSTFRGLVRVAPIAKKSSTKMKCETILLDPTARTETFPSIDIRTDDVKAGHEATVSKVDEEQLFYLQSRGISETEATGLIVGGFLEPIVKELPLEYAVELNKLIHLEMEGSVG